MNRLIFATFFAFCGITIAAPPAPPSWSLPPGEKVLHTISANEMDGETQDWGVANLNIPKAWERTKGKGTVVGVLDTGVDRNHRDLKNQVISAVDFTGSPSGPADKNGHGTWCVGSIVAEENGWGMVGAAPDAKARSYKVLGDSGSGSVEGIARAIRKATDDGCDVLSMSLGGPSADSYIPPALAYAKSKGVIVICAAGNDGPGEKTVGYPGGYPGVICVAAHDDKNFTANFSSRGVQVFVSGPGVNTRAPWPGDRFSTISGTSMATPRIAALALLWCASHTDISKVDRPARFEDALRLACSRPTGPRTTTSGYGKPDAAKLMPTGPVNPEPIPTPPTPVLLTEQSLTEAERTRLKGLGIDKFTLSVSFTTPSKPTPVPVPGSKQTPAKSSDPQPIGQAPGPNFQWKNFPGVGWGWVQDGAVSSTESHIENPKYVPVATPFITPIRFGLLLGNCPNGRCPNR